MVITQIVPWYPMLHTDIIVQSCLTWHADSPLELSIEFETPGAEDPTQTWKFSRDLVGDAFNRPGQIQGKADVQALVDQGTLALSLDSPFGNISMRTEATLVEQFIRRTYEEVPTGEAESGYVLDDLDKALAEILSQ